MATIRKRGEKWQVQVRRQGAVPLSRSFFHKSDAERWARLQEAQADRSILGADPRQLQRLTFADLIRRYQETVTPGKRSAQNERIFLGQLLRHGLVVKTLLQLAPSEFAAYRDERLRVIKPASVLRELVTMQHILEVARRDWGIPLEANPVASIKKPRAGKARARRLERGEADALHAALAKVRNPILGPLFRFAVETGMRRSELLQMEWCHLDRERRLLLIPRSKNGHSRTIPLSKAALRVLSEVEGRDAELVFPISANATRLAWNRLRCRAGMNDLRFHDLRHEAVSRLFEKGLTMPEVALISGHRDPRMLFRYTHLRPEDIVAKLDG